MRTTAALALLLVSMTVNAEPCVNENDESRVTGTSQCLLMHRFGTSPAPHLLVWLHGDGSGGKPARYHLPIAEKAVETFGAGNVISVGLIRPGYPDGSGDASSVAPGHGGRSDHYTRENVSEVASAIRNLKKRYATKRVTVIGHSGGAATTAIMLGMEPDLIDSALLVSCPCDLVAWRTGRRAWTRSENPMDWTEKIPATTRIVALTGSRDDNTIPDLAKRYVDTLLSRGVPARFLEVPDTTHNDALSAKEVNEAIAELIR